MSNEQALMIDVHNLRRLAELPPDVEILRILPPPSHGYPPEWIVDGQRVVYLHIRHRYCMRVVEREVLCVDTLEGFLRAYQEQMPRGAAVG